MIAALGERSPELKGACFIADDATVIGSVELGHDASVWFGAVLRGDNDWIRIGDASNVQDGAILHTDPGIELVVGRGVTIGHRAVLHGCRVGDSSLVGIGAIVLNGASIGADCIVGADALVTENKSFPDGQLILGAPARVARPLGDDEIAAIRRSAEIYVANAKRYRAELRYR